MKLKLNSKEGKGEKSTKESVHIKSPPEAQRFGIKSYLHQFYQSPTQEDLEGAWYLLPPAPKNKFGLYVCRALAMLGLICLIIGATGLVVTYSWPKQSMEVMIDRIEVKQDPDGTIYILHEALKHFFVDPMHPFKLASLIVFASGGALLALSMLLPSCASCFGLGRKIGFGNDVDTPPEPPIRIYSDSRKGFEHHHGEKTKGQDVTIKNNNIFIAQFMHRIPVNRVSWLHTCGCVSLKNIRIDSPNAMIPPPFPAQPIILPDANFTSCLPVPYSKPLEQGVWEDTGILIRGQPEPNSLGKPFWFNIDLYSKNDTVFHFNPRFNQNTVVRNTNQYGFWQAEERSGGFPFVSGQPFIIEIRCTHQGFDVAVNGTHFIHYNHRMSMKKIRGIRVEGDVILSEVTSDYLSVSHIANTTSCLPVPYSKPLEQGVWEDTGILIRGQPEPNSLGKPFWFNVDLYSKNDTVFHFNPRFNQNTVVRNTNQYGFWQAEERSGGFPFVSGQPFIIEIRCTHQGFDVAVNGTHFIHYNHRMSMKKIRGIRVEGDVILSKVTSDYLSVSHIANTTSCLPVPYSKPLELGVWEDTGILIRGQPEPNSLGKPFWFNVDLYSKNDTVFHFNPRFNQNTVVRNTNQYGFWQAEERSGGFPFVSGQPFIIEIRCTHQGFDVAVNGTHFIHYNHRMSMKKIRGIRVEGDVILSEVTSDYLSVSHIANTTSCLPVPYSKPLEQGVWEDTGILIRGQPEPNSLGKPFWFNVDLYSKNDTVFHFNPRFNQNTVVRNTNQYGFWQAEERFGGFPFVSGQPFIIEIRCTHQGFDVAVNGTHFIHYNHRMSMKKIRGIRVEGDVILSEVTSDYLII